MNLGKICCLIFFIVSFFLTTKGEGNNGKVYLIPTDSIEINDFFWYRTLEKADSTITPYKWEMLEKGSDRFNELQKKWEEDFNSTSITGCKKGLTTLKERYQWASNFVKEGGALLFVTLDPHYMEGIERALYNEIASVAYDSIPSEMQRDALSIIKAIPQLTWIAKGKDVYLNLFLNGEYSLKTPELDVHLRLICSMPWQGRSAIMIECAQEQEFTLHLRLPSWADKFNGKFPKLTTQEKYSNYIFSANGERIPKDLKDGYYYVGKKWQDKDFVHFDIPTPIMRISSADFPGKIAIQRGPLVYAVPFLPKNAKLSIKGNISNSFDQNIHCLVLKVPYTETGNSKSKEGINICVPFYLDRQGFRNCTFNNFQ